MRVEPVSRERVPGSGVERPEETKMQEPREPEDLPSEDEAIEREGEKNREAMDEIPEHGTDPLHEGP
jgi:hypothetical protein